MASPIKERPRKTIMLPIVPHTIPTKIDVINARFKIDN